jgi:diacylglycerol kinase family enzyme
LRVTLIANADAGAGAGDAGTIEAAIRAAGHEVRSATFGAGGWERLLDEPADLVAVSGGDGTIGRVAKRMVRRSVPLAALAAGTANNIAMTLGVEALPLAEHIASWTRARRLGFDVVMASGPWGCEPLIEGVGCGLLAASIHRDDKADDDELRKLEPAERLARSLQVLKERVGAFPTTHVHASVDGRDISGDYVLFEAMNTQFVGPNLFLAPDGRVDDGMLDVVFVADGDRARLKDHLASWQRGAMRATPPLECVRGRVLTIAWTGYGVHLDDRPWPDGKQTQARGEATIELRVEPKALEFLLPIGS